MAASEILEIRLFPRGNPRARSYRHSSLSGPSREGSSRRRDVGDDCICSEVPQDLRIKIRKRTTEAARPPERSPSPEVTHTIRIAMKYRDRSGRAGEDDESLEEEDEEAAEGGWRTKNEGSKKGPQGPSNARKEPIKQDGCCVAGVKAALDFTLNCNSVRLTSRDTSLKTSTRSERQERPETRS